MVFANKGSTTGYCYYVLASIDYRHSSQYIFEAHIPKEAIVFNECGYIFDSECRNNTPQRKFIISGEDATQLKEVAILKREYECALAKSQEVIKKILSREKRKYKKLEFPVLDHSKLLKFSSFDYVDHPIYNYKYINHGNNKIRPFIDVNQSFMFHIQYIFGYIIILYINQEKSKLGITQSFSFISQ